MKIALIRFQIVLLFLGSFCNTRASVKDSVLITNLGAESLEIVYNNADSARLLIDKALVLCGEIKHNGLSGVTYNYLGIYYDVVGDNDSAFIAYNKAVEFAKKQKNKTTLASDYYNIGLLHWNLNQLSDASANFFKAAEIYEQTGNEKGLANAYSNIALIFEDQRREDEALDYARRSLSIRLKLQDTLNIGRSYANIGIFLSQKGHTDSGLYYAKKALELRLILGNKKYIAASYGLLGSIYKTRGAYEASDEAFRSAASIYKKYNVQGELWKVYNQLAYVNEALHRPDSALQFLKARLLITDTLHSESKIAKLYEIEEQYESEKTKRELALLADRNTTSCQKCSHTWQG